MKIMKKFLTGTIIILLTIANTGRGVEAKGIGMEGFKLKPGEADGTDRPWFTYQLSPGEKIRDSFIIENNTPEKNQFLLEIKNATIAGDGSFEVNETSKGPSDMEQWIKIEKKAIVIDKREKKVITFVMEIPAETKSGKYQGAIMAIKKVGKIQWRVGLRIFITVNEKTVGILRGEAGAQEEVPAGELTFITICTLCMYGWIKKEKISQN